MAVTRQHDVLSSWVRLGLLCPAIGFAVSLLWDQDDQPSTRPRHALLLELRGSHTLSNHELRKLLREFPQME